MTFSIIILTGLFNLVPGIAEMPYHYTQASGNMGLNGIYLDVLNKRNFVYISGIFSIITLFIPFKMISLFSYGLFAFSIFLYFSSIKKWHKYLT
jgi:hypothetical protein